MKAKVERQEVLATALKWVSDNHIEDYMAQHRNDDDISELKIYFNSIIDWASGTFIETHKEMRNIDWGDFYRRFHCNHYDLTKLNNKVEDLFKDDAVQNKKNIYEYVLDGCQDASLLKIRFFSKGIAKKVYNKQTKKAKAGGYSNCPDCILENGKNAKKIWELNEMEADHVTPWSKGGDTTEENCQMLCKHHNRLKGNS